MIIGIDPGLTGAIALVDGERGLGVWDIPTTGEKTARCVSGALLADTLGEVMDEARAASEQLSAAVVDGRIPVVIERVSAMPGQGVSGMFRFGQSVGVSEGVVGAMRLPLSRVTPGEWKRHWRLLRKDKDAGRALAIDVYPELAHQLTRKKDGGRADALLIAGYAATKQIARAA